MFGYYLDAGNVLELKGEFDEALTQYFKALNIAEKTYGPNSLDDPYLGDCLVNIAEVKEAKGMSSDDVSKEVQHVPETNEAIVEALEFYNKAFEIYKRTLGLEHADTVSSANAIQRLTEEM